MRKSALLVACVAAYLAWPYLALYWIGDALRRGDARTLTATIDWDSVREGLKEDIADGITGEPAATTQIASDALPPFGASFVKGMAGNIVDETVTPEHLAGSLDAVRSASGKSGAIRLNSAWFTSPTSFEASFLLPDEESGAAPVRVRLDLIETGWTLQWRITRAWIPSPVLEQLQTKSS
jgi:hypothetical protein